VVFTWIASLVTATVVSTVPTFSNTMPIVAGELTSKRTSLTIIALNPAAFAVMW